LTTWPRWTGDPALVSCTFRYDETNRYGMTTLVRGYKLQK
jgi:hypothetical protein